MKSISERLDSLPRKVAFPLISLSQVGQIEEPQLEAILDAGELTGNTQHLLGFATGAMAMEAKGVPVCDTVRMARQLGRKIRLDWSPRRWREVHDRLQHLVSLQEISEENCDYDVSYFRQRLPKKFSGYLITTRLRLAKVGLVQRHCVASYHSQVLEQRCAFVCVFIDRKRWTVQLEKTYSGMRITQIRTKYNESPPPHIRHRIETILNMPDGVINEPLATDIPELVDQANLARASQALADQGVQCVELTHLVTDRPQLPGIDANRFTPARPDCLEIEGYCPAAAADDRLEPASHDIESLLEARLHTLVARHMRHRFMMRAYRDGFYEHGELRLDISNDRLEFRWSVRAGARRKPTENFLSWNLCSYEPQVAL